jgi:two-component sensor histidine kinase
MSLRKRAEQQQLNAELVHRVKNVLAAVSAIAAQTKAASRSMDDFLAPNTSNNNTRIKGPDVILRAEAAQTTASVLHELTTKAAGDPPCGSSEQLWLRQERYSQACTL